MGTGQGLQTGDIPSFFFLDPVTSSGFKMSFTENGVDELIGEVITGHYTHSQMASAIREALVAAGTRDYVVVFDRTTRKYTISATDGNFDLLISSGSTIGNSIYPLIGFTGADVTGTDTYEANNQAGEEYIPQFPLRNYTKAGDIKRPTNASVSQATSGKVQVVIFGDVRFLRFDLELITSLPQGQGGIRENLTGKEDAKTFLDFCTSKRTIEMMADYNDKNTFINIFHEKNPTSADGIGYELKPDYRFGPDYFGIRGLEFRIQE